VSYELGRPDYPVELNTLLAEQAGVGPSSTVADVAAGTGKLTRLLALQPCTLLAVEPMPGMRNQLRQAVPSALTVAGTAEQLPLRTGSVEVVTVAQAFHWFEIERASRELRRVLAPGGSLALINNTQISSEPLGGQLWRVLQRFERFAPRPDSTRGWRARLEDAGDFEGWTHYELRHEQVLASPAELEARFTSVSFVLLLEESERARLADAVREVAGGQYPIRFPLRTVIDIGRRVPGPA
jgi:SAM-dependent methyltransferase